MNSEGTDKTVKPVSLLDRIIYFSLKNKLPVGLLMAGILIWGLIVAPFDWESGVIPRDPVPVDAIPDIGENQQIVFTEWMGRSPRDVEDQISYPLTVSLLGVPGVKTVRSYSMFGFSSVYVIFKDNIDFYWSRARILEKLSSLPSGALPEGVQPVLGPDSTALGQVFWYTLEGRDEKGNPTGGWDLSELRSLQDWVVRYALLSAEGISEVASVGGHIKEYQIDVDPESMKAFNVGLTDVFNAVKMSNSDVGARSIEINSVEYIIRGVGFIKKIEDIENTVIRLNDNVPVYIRNIGRVSFGPGLRRGALDRNGSEVVGGVAVVRYGENPLAAIKNLKKKIREITPGLPERVLPDGTKSRVRIIPFYDRTGLINETLDTLNTALTEEILVTMIVVILLLLNLRSSVLISGLLPLAVLMSFIAMKYFGVDANIVALSGIAIAIGTMVDMGIVFVENIMSHLEKARPGENRLNLIFRASSEVGSAVITAVATTVVSFLPVFTMIGAEGKLFRPLAFTKTFALVSSIIIAIMVIPPAAHLIFRERRGEYFRRPFISGGVAVTGILVALLFSWWIGAILTLTGMYKIFERKIPASFNDLIKRSVNVISVLIVTVILARYWYPLGPEKGLIANFLFILFVVGGVLFLFFLFRKNYETLLKFAMAKRKWFFSTVGVIVLTGMMSWLGFNAFFGWLPDFIKRSSPVSYISHKFPGLGKEFMPPLDEGTFLYMPTTMPHASIGEVLDILSKQDIGFSKIPEIDTAVGKLGRADTPLDPAPVSMIETVINYKSRFKKDRSGRVALFRYDPSGSDLFRDEYGNPVPGPNGKPYRVRGKFARTGSGELIPDRSGHPFSLWRLPLVPEMNPGRDAWTGIRSPADIWDEIVKAGKITGTTSAPMLQPIAARIVMLQSGMRAPMGVKIKGPSLEVIERTGIRIERLLKEVPSIEASAVIADRIIGKPYIEIEIDRKEIARYGISLRTVQDVIEVAVGGKKITTTIEGRERVPVRVRYFRELRDNITSLSRVLVPSPGGAQIPLDLLSTINFVRGPQVIKSEDTFLTGYVLFDKKHGFSEVDTVRDAEKYLEHKRDTGEFDLPEGTSYAFAGSYENQVRSEKTLALILPLSLFIIFLILYFQFGRISSSLLVFSGVIVAWSGGFIMIWLYNQPWFLDFSVLGMNLRELFHVAPIDLSVAVWVGFLALFGIATDDGVLITTYLDQLFKKNKPSSIEEIRKTTIEAGLKRVRPALMTTATTILALLPVLMSTGRGSDIMIPMAIPTFGGMSFALITLFVVPVTYSWIMERRLLREHGGGHGKKGNAIDRKPLNS